MKDEISFAMVKMSENGGGNILYITGGKSNIQKATTKPG